MRVFWEVVLEPLIALHDPKVIVEIGSEEGATTRLLLATGAERGRIVHSIDPLPAFDVEALRQEYVERFIPYLGLSLDVLTTINEPFDLVLIDGDHNWYTVFNELRLIERLAAENGVPHPLVLLHDVGWPYARRDLYYDPSVIPEAHRKPFAKAGMLQGRSELLEGAGLNAHLQQATFEHGEENGVLTAVEDFLSATELELQFINIPVWHGLGILYGQHHVDANPELAAFLSELTASDALRAVMERAESKALKLMVEVRDQAHRIGHADERIRVLQKQAQSDAAAQRAKVEALSRLNDALQESVIGMNKHKQTSDARLAEAERSLAAQVQALADHRKAAEAQLAEAAMTPANRRLRKLRKLRRDPVQFFKDASVVRKAASNGSTMHVFWKGVRSALNRHGLLPQSNPKVPNVVNNVVTSESRAGVNRPGVTVVIPVFNAFDEVRRCIDSSVRTLSAQDRLLIVDDGSTDRRIRPLLRQYQATNGCIQLIENDQNLGYTRTINIAVRSVRSDVVLLNSDTIVPPLWLDLLYESAYAEPTIGTVTAVSNNAGAFSLPKINQQNKIPDGFVLNSFAEFVRDLAKRDLPTVPTGSGFCFYVRRDVFDRIGYFDETAFPRGYGEENDFCLRAEEAGFRNVVDDGVFIFHTRSASFGDEKGALIEQSQRILRSRYPSYKSRINELLANHPLHYLGERIEAALLARNRDDSIPLRGEDRSTTALRAQGISGSAHADRPSVLFVIHDGGGGSVLTNLDLISVISHRFRCYLLLCNKTQWRLVDPESNDDVDQWKFDVEWRFENLPDPERLSVFRSICARYDIQLVHFRSLIGIAPEYLAAAKELGLRMIFSFHDFYTICPTIQLIDDRERYCGGVCSSGGSECRLSKKWFSNSPALKDAYVYRWRERVRAGLRVCDAFVTTSWAAHDTLTTYYPSISDRLHVIEHGRDVEDDAWISVPPTGSTIRMVCMGALGRSKGARLLKSIFELNAKRRETEAHEPNFEFHVFGPVDRVLEDEISGVVRHGPYERAELRDLVAKVQPSFSLICSIWPETYCHTLTESWHFGLPVFASDIGTIRERIDRHGGGWLLDYSDPEDWFRRMLEIASDATTYSDKIQEIREMRFRTVSEMAQDYEQLYRGVLSAIDENGIPQQDSLSG